MPALMAPPIHVRRKKNIKHQSAGPTKLCSLNFYLFIMTVNVINTKLEKLRQTHTQKKHKKSVRV